MASVDVERVIAYEKVGLLRVQKHPERPLFIANYTPRVQYDRLWDDLTLMCRGLIFADDGTIVARPFPKFFNLGEPDAPPVPDETFEVTEKVDGSLGILYWIADTPYIASRGSFTSEQAQRATIWLHRQPEKWRHLRAPGMTYLFEIIYPENRIVVDYGDRDELVFLAGIDTESGKDVPYARKVMEGLDWPVVPQHDGIADMQRFTQLFWNTPGGAEGEGFVLRFTESGTRLKVKHPEYLRLHKLLNGVNNRRIWEVMSAGQSLESLLDCVPDEFARWVRAESDRLLAEHARITAEAEAAYEPIRRAAAHDMGIHDMSVAGSVGAMRELRKAFAARAASYPHSWLLFVLFDGGDMVGPVWRMLKPEEAEAPFAAAEK